MYTAVLSAAAAGSGPAARAVPAVGYMPMPDSFKYKKTFRHGRPRHRKYDAFWLKHPPMDTGHRAKIFAPFDALRGFDLYILAKEVPYTDRRELSEEEKDKLNQAVARLYFSSRGRKITGNGGLSAEITWFSLCTDRKSPACGVKGLYRTVSGTVEKVDPEISRTIVLDGQVIALEDICRIRILVPEEDL